MRAERKSPATIKCYGDGVRSYLRWCEASGNEPLLSKASAQAWIADLLGNGAEGSTAKARAKGLRRFCAWLVAEGELSENPMAGMAAPKVDQKVVAALSEDQLKRLLKACAGKDWRDRRDEAIVRLMLETGARASEVVGLQSADVDLDRELVTIRRGKGGKGRVVPIGAQTVLALDRYLRARRSRGQGDVAALSARAGRSATTAFPTRSKRGHGRPVSRASTSTFSATPSPPGGRRRRAPTTDSWRSPAGRAGP